MANLKNRTPEVEEAAAELVDHCTKAELLEVAYHLATLAAGGEHEALARLLEEINLGRSHRGEKVLRKVSKKCPFCKGKGKVSGGSFAGPQTVHVCSLCSGSGKVERY